MQSLTFFASRTVVPRFLTGRLSKKPRAQKCDDRTIKGLSMVNPSAMLVTRGPYVFISFLSYFLKLRPGAVRPKDSLSCLARGAASPAQHSAIAEYAPA